MKSIINKIFKTGTLLCLLPKLLCVEYNKKSSQDYLEKYKNQLEPAKIKNPRNVFWKKYLKIAEIETLKDRQTINNIIYCSVTKENIIIITANMNYEDTYKIKIKPREDYLLLKDIKITHIGLNKDNTQKNRKKKTLNAHLEIIENLKLENVSPEQGFEIYDKIASCVRAFD